MISFEFKRPSRSGDSPDQLDVFLDAEGLRDLMVHLRRLELRESDHCHFFTPDWGGYELVGKPYLPENIRVHHVKIYLRE